MNLPELFIWANAMQGERFSPVTKFEGRFWISDFSRIVSYDHRKNTVNFLRPHIDNEGYYATQLRMKPKQRKVRVHVLTAEHYVDKKEPAHIWVNHLLGIKLWNYYKDLEWCLPAQNCAHAVETGLHNLKGEKHPNKKLTEFDVKKIRELRNNGLTHKDISKQFNISRRQAGDIINRKNWGWLV